MVWMVVLLMLLHSYTLNLKHTPRNIRFHVYLRFIELNCFKLNWRKRCLQLSQIKWWMCIANWHICSYKLTRNLNVAWENFPIQLGIILRSHFENLIFSSNCEWTNLYFVCMNFIVQFVQFDDKRKNTNAHWINTAQHYHQQLKCQADNRLSKYLDLYWQKKW